MKLWFLGALVAVGLWAQPSYASNVVYITDQTTSTFLLTGYNSDFNAQGELSLVQLNIQLGAPEVDQQFYTFTASTSLPPIVSPYEEILLSDTNGYAESACRYEPCTSSYNFYIPIGVLNIDVTVSVYLAAACYDFGDGDCESPDAFVFGTPIFELELLVPDYLSLAPIPTPATFPLFATSLGALVLFGWRRKRRQVV
jgi:hypothetical protein